MKTYNMHEAKTNLSKIVNEVNEGEIVYLARSGKVVAEIKSVAEKKKPLPYGKFRDQIKMSDDFDSWPDDMENAFSFE